MSDDPRVLAKCDRCGVIDAVRPGTSGNAFPMHHPPGSYQICSGTGALNYTYLEAIDE